MVQPGAARRTHGDGESGANGIDGVVSTALGIAASGRRTFALLGDLAFLHDVSGLVNLPDAPCTFIVLDNGGGESFLSYLKRGSSSATSSSCSSDPSEFRRRQCGPRVWTGRA